MSASREETEPLYHSDPEEDNTSLEPPPPYYDDGEVQRYEGEARKGALHERILYALSLLISIGGLGCGIWGYAIVISAPFDENSKRMERDGYEKNFYGMQSVLVLLAVNIIWSGLNFYLVSRGSTYFLGVHNMIYDFLIWALLIAFGVLNMVEALWDRRLCDGVRDDEMYKKCDIAMFQLLVVELVSVNLGLLVAVLHFILLIARCCSTGMIRERIRREEQILMGLIERRNRLLEETEQLEARRARFERDLPPIPQGVGGDEELIDVTTQG